MAHPLQQKLGQVRRRARFLMAVYGIGWVAGSVLLTVLVLGLLDYLIHFQDRGIRALCTLAVLGVFLWTTYRYLYGSLTQRLRDLDVAQRIERRFPALNDRLSSTVEFLNQDEADIQAGSAALRRAVIVDAEAEVGRLNLAEVIESRPAWRAARIAASIAAIALIVTLIHPQLAGIALARLARPFGDDAWPKRHHLEFRNPPEQVASGQHFEVELVDRHDGVRLPDVVRIHYIYDNAGQDVEEVEEMRPLNGVMMARKEHVTRPFRYRAVGGDDQSMAWRELRVVEPPRVESLKIKLAPPSYTGWPRDVVDKNFQALRGSRMEVVAVTTKPLKSAMLKQEHGPDVPLQIGKDGYGFSLAVDAKEPWMIDKPGAYWFELIDTSDLPGGQDDRWEVRAVADQPPTVVIEQPAANVYVTSEAAIALKMIARDDLAVRDVTLRFTRSQGADVADDTVALFTGPPAVEPVTETPPMEAGRVGDSRHIEHRWELGPLRLKPGQQITFYAEASDYLPHTGKSQERRLLVISPQELEDRIAQRQTLILGELGRVLKMQQDARGQTTSLEIQMREVGQLNKQDIDHAQGAELNQRQIARTLTSPAEGIPAQINDLLADLASNKVDSPDVQRRMEGILKEVGRLNDEHLGGIQQDLTGVIKGAQAKLAAGEKQPAKTPADARIAESLTSAGKHQDEVVRSLETMLGELSEWDTYRRFGRDVAQVRREQEEIQAETKKLGDRTLTKDVKELDAQQQADLKKLATRQQELGRRLDKVEQQMEEMSRSLAETDPLAAATLGDALHHARRQAISGQMKQSSGQVEKNQVGQAMQKQQQIARELEELQDILANKREHELTRLVKKLREAEAELAKLRQQQEGLRKKMAAAEQKANPEERRRELERLAKQQKQLQEEAQRFARRLERLQAQQAGKQTASAAGKMGQAGQAGEKGAGEQAGEQAEGAKKDLDDAQQKLAERRQQAEADLAREQMARIEDALKSLHGRQQQANEETGRLEGLRAGQGQFTRSQSISVRDAARQQQGLDGEVRSLAEKIAAAEVFHRALISTSREMTRAAELLEQRETGEPTNRAQQSALNKLSQLLIALKNEKKPGKPGQDGGQGGGGGGSSGGQGDGIRNLAQVKLLKLMQEDLHARFLTLTEQPPDRQAAEAESLAQEQGELADLALKLSQPVEKRPEDDPASLPDLSEEKPGAKKVTIPGGKLYPLDPKD